MAHGWTIAAVVCAAFFATPAVAGCSSEPFESSPEALARYSGAGWLPDGTAVAVMSQDDGARHARGYRNRWRYTITGVAVLPWAKGCSEREVAVRTFAGGSLSVAIDGVALTILPGDPEVQERISRTAGACEFNRQMVRVEEVGGRWLVTIEEPNSMPWTRRRC